MLQNPAASPPPSGCTAPLLQVWPTDQWHPRGGLLEMAVAGPSLVLHQNLCFSGIPRGFV